MLNGLNLRNYLIFILQATDSFAEELFRFWLIFLGIILLIIILVYILLTSKEE
jgi:DMSO/TMAO reductase YedYZ heme-binding membrane subunit